MKKPASRVERVVFLLIVALLGPGADGCSRQSGLVGPEGEPLPTGAEGEDPAGTTEAGRQEEDINDAEASTPQSCLAEHAACAVDAQCCSGLCSQGPDGMRVCAQGYQADGAPCQGDSDCSLGLCNGQKVCGPEGCLGPATSCNNSDDCCSGFCDPIWLECAPAAH